MASPLVNLTAEYGHGTALFVNPAQVGGIEVCEGGGAAYTVQLHMAGRTFRVGMGIEQDDPPATAQDDANTKAAALEAKLWP